MTRTAGPWVRAAVVIALGALGCRSLGGPPAAPARALIEFGWDEPDTAFLRARLPQMERTPFDGCVYHVLYSTADGKQGNLAWDTWGRRAFVPADFAAARADLEALPPSRFRQNFLRINTTPADVDWFDDFSPILGNVRVAAQLARVGGGPGLLLDVEGYQKPLFDYRQQRDRGTRSYEQYAAQARLRGRQVMQAAQRGARNTTVLLTFGASLPLYQQTRQSKPLSELSYGLLAPFVDGLASAAPPGLLVDGHELSYGYRSEALFAEARHRIREGVLPLLRHPARYQRVISAGFGVWMDYEWRQHGWHPDTPEKNYFTPEVFEQSVRAALAASDRYVWVYSETPRWWSPEGGPVKLPPVYDEALRRARAAFVPHEGR